MSRNWKDTWVQFHIQNNYAYGNTKNQFNTYKSKYKINIYNYNDIDLNEKAGERNYKNKD